MPANKKYKVTAEEFVTAWNTSKTAKEVSERLKMPPAIVHARASKYRKAGVRLKSMSQRGGPIDVDKLNAIIDDLETKDGTKRRSSDAVDEEVVDIVVKKVLQELKKQGES